jgi:hypothetical protein
VAAAPGSRITRRRLLVGLLLIPPAVSGCALDPSTRKPVDPLTALADAARADAALATAAISADPGLAVRVQPLVDARTQHAAALDAEVLRLRPGSPSTSPAATPAPPAVGRPVTLAQVRAAAQSAADAAAAVALDLPVDRVGLAASVSACCAAYATVLT